MLRCFYFLTFNPKHFILLTRFPTKKAIRITIACRELLLLLRWKDGWGRGLLYPWVHQRREGYTISSPLSRDWRQGFIFPLPWWEMGSIKGKNIQGHFLDRPKLTPPIFSHSNNISFVQLNLKIIHPTNQLEAKGLKEDLHLKPQSMLRLKSITGIDLNTTCMRYIDWGHQVSRGFSLIWMWGTMLTSPYSI